MPKTVDFSTSDDKVGGFTTEAAQLYAFMDKYYIIDGEKQVNQFTHDIWYVDPKSKIGRKGLYNIPPFRQGLFLELYTKALQSGERMYISEKAKDFGPLTIDLEFTTEYDDRCDRVYDIDLIKNVVKNYCRIAKECMSVTSQQLLAYVLEQDEPYLYNGFYHDTVRIIFPSAVCLTEAQLLIRDRFIEYADKSRLFANVTNKSSGEIVSKSAILSANHLLYGSTKSKETPEHKVSHIYVYAGKEVYESYLGPVDLEDLTYITSFQSCSPSDVLCVKPEWREAALGSTAEDSENVDFEIAFDAYRPSVNKATIKDDKVFAEAKLLISMLSAKRASHYHSWYQVGCCLHNLDNRFYLDWVEFSRKTTRKNFDEETCRKTWDEMEPNNFTMASLHFFARIDSQAMYENYIADRATKKLNEIARKAKPSHAGVWQYVVEKYPYRFVCAAVREKTWYEFREHRWVKQDSASDLYKVIATEIWADVVALNKRIATRAIERGEDINDKTKSVRALIDKLETDGFINGVISHGSNMNKIDKFESLLDSNVNLICFTNGVYDLEANIFRDGCPDDYISLHTKYAYRPYQANDPVYVRIMDFFRKIMPDPEMREYLLTILAISICGSIEEQKFYIFTGSGSNGKSRLMSLMGDVLGELYKTMDIQVLVGKKGKSNEVQPEIVDKKGVRLCPFNEPGHEDKLNCSLMKTLTGDEEITARGLWQSNIYFVPQFTCVMVCNDTPEIQTDDGGTWRRIDVVDFVAKFVKRSERTEKYEHELPPNHYFVDPNLKNDMKSWVAPLMALLIERHIEYRKHGYVTPRAVIERNIRFRRECDKYQDFMYDYLEKVNDITQHVTIQSLHAGFRNWWRINGFGHNAPSIKILENYMKLKVDGYNSKDRALYGYTLKAANMDD